MNTEHATRPVKLVPLPRLRTIHIALTAMYVVVAAAVLYTSEGMLDATGHMIGRDFVNPWSAAKAWENGKLIQIADPAAYMRWQHELFGHPMPPHYWSYPPTMLLIAAPLGQLEYGTALALWSTAGLALYLLATRRLTLLAAPAVFINLAGGQTGFVVGALFLGGLGQLDKRPVLAGVMFGLIAVKPHLGALIPLALLGAGAWRAMASAAITVTAMVLASAALFGWEAWRVYAEVSVPFQVEVLQDHRGVFQAMMPSAFMAMRIIGWEGGAAAYAAQAPITVLALTATWLAFRHRTARTRASADSVLLLATIAATPYVLNYDMTLLAPAALAGLERAERGEATPSEALVWFGVWILPIGVMVVNAMHMPVGWLILAMALMVAASPMLPKHRRHTRGKS